MHSPLGIAGSILRRLLLPHPSGKEGRDLIASADRLFIAYSHTDLRNARLFRRRALRLRAGKSEMSVFLDQDMLRPGENVTEQDIDKEIDSSDLFVILCGLDTGDRRQVNREVRRALERRSRGLLKILPVLLQARASIPNGIDFAIQAPFLTTIFPEVARARIATVAFSAVLLTAAVSFSVMWLTGFNLQRYVHYRVLSGPVAEHAEKGASGQPGKFVRDAYGEVWLQRFEAGMLILPTAEEKFTFHDGDRSFSNSLFILHVTGTDNAAQERGEWFLQRRPPTRGDFYDARDFADFARNVRSEWETLLRWQPSSGLKIDEIIAMFSPHSESSPVNLCGALALAYAKYRLDRYLGRPVEHQFDGTMLLRAYSFRADLWLLTSCDRPINRT
jgi:hypothetical protein